jgi:hypothetical protein
MAAADLDRMELRKTTHFKGGVRTLPVVALGMALSLFLVISYVICGTSP